MNFVLGNSYTFVSRHENYDEFCKSFRYSFGRDHVADLDESADQDTKNCYAFVSNEDGNKLYALFQNQKNYIMTENGKTFSNVSLN